MIRTFFVLLLLASAAMLAAYEPSGDITELSDLSRLIHARTGMQGRMFSSYDRSGGNDDGFKGTYSRLRVEAGNSVLAEMTGPGAIQRIWFTHTDMADGLLGRKREHLRIFIDGHAEPVVDLPLEDVFSGRNPRFPAPLAGTGMGGFYCYVPIPFRSACRVEVQGTEVRFYQVQWNQFAASTPVKPFAMTLDREEEAQLARAVQVWSRPGDVAAFGPFPDIKRTSRAISLAAGETVSIPLPIGPGLVRAIELEVAEREWPAWSGARLAATWDEASMPGLDLPVEYLFAQAMQPAPFSSLLAGVSGQDQGSRRFYNVYPMPYRQSGQFVLTAPAGVGINGTLTVSSTPLAWADDILYAHAAYTESLPTVPKQHHPWLVRSGRGHFAGVYMATEGGGTLPGWLEGDEIFTCDGDMRIHGTGSEDYFNCGWYGVNRRLDSPGTRPLHGFPVYASRDGVIRACAFRWHLGDVVPFERQIRAEIEHGPVNEMAIDYRSATFWYDDRPAIGPAATWTGAGLPPGIPASAGAGWGVGADRVLADFEGGTWRGWTATGAAFGESPAPGTLANQGQVTGFMGRGLANSFRGGDAATGTLTSPEFVIDRAYLNLLVGGGAAEAAVTLVIDGKPVRSASGRGSEQLAWVSWNLVALKGRTAQVAITDRATGAWGHILADQIVLSDTALAEVAGGP